MGKNMIFKEVTDLTADFLTTTGGVKKVDATLTVPENMPENKSRHSKIIFPVLTDIFR